MAAPMINNNGTWLHVSALNPWRRTNQINIPRLKKAQTANSSPKPNSGTPPMEEGMWKRVGCMGVIND